MPLIVQSVLKSGAVNITALLMAANAAILAPTIASTVAITAPIEHANASIFVPAVVAQKNLTAPTKNANATFAVPAVVAEKQVAAPVCTANATMLAPTISVTVAITAPIKNVNATMPVPTSIGVSAIGITAPIMAANASAPTPEVVYGALYSYIIDFSFVIPNQFAKFDLVGIGGSEGSQGGSGAYYNGGGSYAGNWNNTTIERGVDISIDVRTITGTIGQGGSGGGCPGGWGNPGTDTVFTSLLTCTGSGSCKAMNDWTGNGAGNQTINGITYVGGDVQAGGFAWGGNPPGGGAAGGQGGLINCVSGGATGAHGEAWIYAYTKTGFNPPIWMDLLSAVGNANATMPTPTASVVQAVTAPFENANASILVPTLSSTVAVTAPIKNANATLPVPTFVAQRNLSVTTPFENANATMPTPAVGFTSTNLFITAPIMQANASAVAPSDVIYGALYSYTASGAFSFTIPNKFAKFDLVGVSGGPGGSGGGVGYQNGGGGVGGNWNNTTIERGAGFSADQRTITGSVGIAGTGGSCNLNWGAWSGSTVFDGGLLTCAGLNNDKGAGDWTGNGAGNQTINGITYVGGAAQAGGGGWGGNAPGGGGAAGFGGLFGCAGGGGPGGIGGAWIYAYTKTGFNPPIWLDMPSLVGAAQGHALAPTVVAEKQCTAPTKNANATMPVPTVSCTAYDNVGASSGGTAYGASPRTFTWTETVAANANCIIVPMVLWVGSASQTISGLTCKANNGTGSGDVTINQLDLYMFSGTTTKYYVALFGLIGAIPTGPTVTFTVVATASAAGTIGASAESVSYKGATSFGTVTRGTAASAPSMSTSGTTIGKTLFQMFGLAAASGAFSAYSKTSRWNRSGNNYPPGVAGETPGSASTVTFTATATGTWGGLLVPIT